eukprot:TRINITY_DN2242_c0_g1_i3.p1 TRINITY_DN2242_c0_g1~~TRINITY_DN2242_c0_g1_i3.p1  ORF type:complete len:151 (-),score=9.12 TRINITY_DN2242_c0_g1_i3:966-1418(-)
MKPQIGNSDSIIIKNAWGDPKVNKIILTQMVGKPRCDRISLILKSPLHSYLTSVEFIGNDIDQDGLVVIADSLKTNSTIEELILVRNKLGPSGTKILSEAIAINKSINTLNLTANRLGPEGCKYLSESLLTNTTLQRLKLSCIPRFFISV